LIMTGLFGNLGAYQPCLHGRTMSQPGTLRYLKSRLVTVQPADAAGSPVEGHLARDPLSIDHELGEINTGWQAPTGRQVSPSPPRQITSARKPQVAERSLVPALGRAPASGGRLLAAVGH
jgi:hypothetical protein